MQSALQLLRVNLAKKGLLEKADASHVIAVVLKFMIKDHAHLQNFIHVESIKDGVLLITSTSSAVVQEVHMLTDEILSVAKKIPMCTIESVRVVRK